MNRINKNEADAQREMRKGQRRVTSEEARRQAERVQHESATRESEPLTQEPNHEANASGVSPEKEWSVYCNVYVRFEPEGSRELNYVYVAEQERAQKIVDAHNASLAAPSLSSKEGEEKKGLADASTLTTKGVNHTSSPATVYPSCEAANDALGPCPRALAESDGGHWWYIDHEAEEKKHTRGSAEDFDYIECECKSCPQKMRLSADAEEYPL